MVPSLRLLCLAALLSAALACSDEGAAPAATGGSPAAGGGAPATPVAGSGGTGGSSVPLAGSGQAVGDGDQGQPFAPSDVVMIMPPEVGGMMNGGSGGGPAIPGDGKVMTATLRRGMSGTAVFTQTGEDVTVVFDLTGGCSDGEHEVAIHDGYACDSAVTEGAPWGERGTGFGPISCSGGKGMLSYTRSGADKTKNWTVADHVQETDVTAHVLIIANGDDPRAGCANFF